MKTNIMPTILVWFSYIFLYSLLHISPELQDKLTDFHKHRNILHWIIYIPTQVFKTERVIIYQELTVEMNEADWTIGHNFRLAELAYHILQQAN